MTTWDDSFAIAQEFASDTSATTLTSLQRYLNIGYKYILAQLGRPITERTTTTSTKANQQYYQLPPDYLFLKSVTVNQGGIPYPVMEEESQDNWDILNATTTQSADIPQRFFIRKSFGLESEVGFYPTPSTAGLVFTLVYEANDKDLSQVVYNTGTVSVTNGSSTIIGSGTTFTTGMVGRFFKFAADGFWYKIASFTSVSQIDLDNDFQGATDASSGTYTINEIFALPEEMQILPCYFAAAHFYHIKRDPTERDKYWALFNDGMTMGMRRHATKSRGSIIKGDKAISRFPVWGPVNFPSNVT